MAKLILRQVLYLWWHRNKHRHGNVREEEADIRRKRALARCEELAKRVVRLKRGKELFVAAEKIQSWNPGMILHYLAGAEPLVEKCLENEIVSRPTPKWDRTKGEVYDPP